MVSDIQETIVALSSAPGAGGRAIVRLSGGKAFPIAFAFFEPIGAGTQYPVPRTSYSVPVRRRYEGALRLAGLSSTLPASLLVWPEPRTYTGQNLAELHLLSSPPLVELLITSLLNAGARAAQPGEFTDRSKDCATISSSCWLRLKPGSISRKKTFVLFSRRNC